MVVEYGKKVKKKEFDFPIDEELDRAIEAMVNAINENDILADCYMAELYNEINNSLHITINDEQAEELRNYYIRGGMYEQEV